MAFTQAIRVSYLVTVIIFVCAFSRLTLAGVTPCEPKPCLLVDCPFGYKVDDSGCTICECADPCSEVTCAEGEVCTVERHLCIRAPCPPAGVCVSTEEICGMETPEPMPCGFDPNWLPCNPTETCRFYSSQSMNGFCCFDESKAPPTFTGPCTLARAQLDAFAFMPGGFAPECTEGGMYKRMQCHHSIGACWCVKDDGTEIYNTRRSIRNGESLPNCESGPCLDDVRAIGEPAPGTFVPQCNENGMYDKMQCHGSIGECWCSEEDGTEISNTRVVMRYGNVEPPNCDPNPTPCFDEKDALGEIMPGMFIPTCREDGMYEKVQCHGSSGHCWCVTENGDKIEESVVRFREPECD